MSLGHFGQVIVLDVLAAFRARAFSKLAEAGGRSKSMYHIILAKNRLSDNFRHVHREHRPKWKIARNGRAKSIENPLENHAEKTFVHQTTKISRSDVSAAKKLTPFRQRVFLNWSLIV